MSVKPNRELSIGLFGGSFNPAHAGHLHVAMAGLRELQLDQVWWLVSPQNPLKPKQPDPINRANTIRSLNIPFQMRVSHLESELGTQYTVDLLKALRARHPGKRFVYMIGADNLEQMPAWKDWQTIFQLAPIAIIARPGYGLKSRLGHVARQMEGFRIPEWQAHALKDCHTPAWTYLTLPMNPLSSTDIRAGKAATQE